MWAASSLVFIYCASCFYVLGSHALKTLKQSSHKHFVVACNAYPDGRPALVGVQTVDGEAHAPPSGAFASRLREARRKAHAADAAMQSEGTPLAVMGQGGVAALQMRPGDAGNAAGAAGRGITAAAAAAYAAAAAAAGSADQPDRDSGPLVTARGPLRPAKHDDKALAAAGPLSPLQSALWIRSLSFGQCEEYHVDISQHTFFFIAPGRTDASELVPPARVSGEPMHESHNALDAFDDPLAEGAYLDPAGTGLRGAGHFLLYAAATMPTADRILAVLVQPEASSSSALVHSLALIRHGPSNGLPVAELAALDGFTQASSQRQGPVEAELERLERQQGLESLSALGSGAVVRLEDFIDHGSISSKVLGTRTLGLGASYAVEPSHVHLILEDLKDAHMLDKRDVQLEGGQTYVAIRVGKGNDQQYPQQLLFYRVQDQVKN